MTLATAARQSSRLAGGGGEHDTSFLVYRKVLGKHIKHSHDAYYVYHA